jgi:hypothetical protein
MTVRDSTIRPSVWARWRATLAHHLLPQLDHDLTASDLETILTIVIETLDADILIVPRAIAVPGEEDDT